MFTRLTLLFNILLILFLPVTSNATTKAQEVDFLISGLHDSSGNPLANGKVYIYKAGTTTAAYVYYDRHMTNAAPNPLILDSRGAATVFGFGMYKFVVYDSNNNYIATYDNVDIGVAVGNFIDIAEFTDYPNPYPSLNKAVTAIGSNPATLKITTYTILEASLTVPENITLYVEHGGDIDVGAYTLTISGGFIAPPVTVFHNGAGNIIFDSKAVDYVRPEWWGAPSGGEDTSRLNYAISAANGKIPVVLLAGKTYTLENIIPISGTVIMGLNQNNKPIIYSKTSGATKVFNLSNTKIKLENLYIEDKDSASSLVLVDITGSDIELRNVHLKSDYRAISITSTAENVRIADSVIEGKNILDNMVTIDGADNVTVSGSYFTGGTSEYMIYLSDSLATSDPNNVEITHNRFYVDNSSTVVNKSVIYSSMRGVKITNNNFDVYQTGDKLIMKFHNETGSGGNLAEDNYLNGNSFGYPTASDLRRYSVDSGINRIALDYFREYVSVKTLTASEVNALNTTPYVIASTINGSSILMTDAYLIASTTTGSGSSSVTLTFSSECSTSSEEETIFGSILAADAFWNHSSAGDRIMHVKSLKYGEDTDATHTIITPAVSNQICLYAASSPNFDSSGVLKVITRYILVGDNL